MIPALPAQLPFNLCVTNMQGQHDITLLSEAKPFALQHGETVAVTWGEGRKPIEPQVKEDPSVFYKIPVVDNTVTMDECIAQFCHKEMLSADNLWSVLLARTALTLQGLPGVQGGRPSI